MTFKTLLAAKTGEAISTRVVEMNEHLTWPGFQARLPQLGKFIAEIGLDEMERRLGYYIGIGNQQP